MSPQVHWPTRILEVTAQSVKVRALHDGQQVAILLEYADPSEDPDDAAAVEFMVGDKKAHFAHGQPMSQVQGGPVDIWFWKNKDAKVVDMSAQGFGTLKAQDKQETKGKGVYQNGTWRVVFSRALAPEISITIRRSNRVNTSIWLLRSGTERNWKAAISRKRDHRKRFRLGGISVPSRHPTIPVISTPAWRSESRWPYSS